MTNPFEHVVNLALETPGHPGRAFLDRDLGRIASGRTRRRSEAQTQARASFDQQRMALESGHFGYGHLDPEYRAPRFDAPSTDGTTNHTGYMLDRIMRDAALSSYDNQMRGQALAGVQKL